MWQNSHPAYTPAYIGSNVMSRIPKPTLSGVNNHFLDSSQIFWDVFILTRGPANLLLVENISKGAMAQGIESLSLIETFKQIKSFKTLVKLKLGSVWQRHVARLRNHGKNFYKSI